MLYRIARNVCGVKLWRISKNIALAKKLWRIANLGINQKFRLPDESGGPGVKLGRIEVRQNIETACKTLQRIAARTYVIHAGAREREHPSRTENARSYSCAEDIV